MTRTVRAVAAFAVSVATAVPADGAAAALHPPSGFQRSTTACASLTLPGKTTICYRRSRSVLLSDSEERALVNATGARLGTPHIVCPNPLDALKRPPYELQECDPWVIANGVRYRLFIDSVVQLTAHGFKPSSGHRVGTDPGGTVIALIRAS